MYLRYSCKENMKIIEKKIKNGFSNLFSQRKKKRMLQYKFKDEFLEKLQNCFDANKGTSSAKEQGNGNKDNLKNNIYDKYKNDDLDCNIDGYCEIVDL